MRGRHVLLPILLVLILYPAVSTAEPTAAQIKLPSGVTLQYATQGRPEGQPLVLLHGLGDSWRSYELVLPHIPDRYRVYAVSLRGHGWSDGPDSGYTQRDFGGDVAALLEALDLRHVTLVGHSLGSFVAQWVAVHDKGRIARLVLVGSGPGGVGTPAIREDVQRTFRAMRGPVDATFAREFQMSTAHAPVSAAFMERMYEQILRAAPHMWSAAAEALYSADTADALSTIKVPTLLIWGDKDALLLRADQDALLARLPNARLVAFTGNGHAPHWENPARFATEVIAFADRK